MADITKPDANPVVSALLTALVFNLGHLVINGQQRKWVYTLVVSFVGSIVTCGLLGIVMVIMSTLDAYQTAERLQKGETIGENEYTFAPLYKLMKIVDKTATCKNA